MSKNKKIKVYAETKIHAEHIATFYNEELYMMFLPKLKAWAWENGFTHCTESEE